MARLIEAQREEIRNQLILGASQYAIARDYEVSSATVNKIFKTIQEDEFLVKEVKEEIAIKSKLFNQSESLVKAFDTKVNDELRRKNLVYNITEKVLNKIDVALSSTTPIFDEKGKEIGRQENILDSKSAKEYIDAIDKASLTLAVNQRHSNQVINNTNATQVNNENNKLIVEFK